MRSTLDWKDDRIWEHRLPIFLMGSFFLAAGATLAHPPPPAAVAAPAPVVVAPATRVVSPLADLIPVQIADVLLPEGTSSGVVLLQDTTAQSVLPVFLKASEGAAVRESLQSGDPRSAPELFSHAVQALGGEVQRVEVTQGAEEAVSCRVVLNRDGQETALDAAPADALALAATTHAPVYTTSKMLDSQGIRRETIQRLPDGLPSRLRHPDAF